MVRQRHRQARRRLKDGVLRSRQAGYAQRPAAGGARALRVYSEAMRIRTISLIALGVGGHPRGHRHHRGARASPPDRAARTKPPIVKKYIALRRQRARRRWPTTASATTTSTPTCSPSRKAVVLHHTDGADWQSAWNTFDNNTAYVINGVKEKPGVSAHFIIAKDGTIYQLHAAHLPRPPLHRHELDVSFGIEFVPGERAGKDGHWMDRQILNRTKQINAGLKLVR